MTRIGPGVLTRAATELSERYRLQRPASNRFPAPFMTTDAHRSAYAAIRMPATFAAARAVFAEVSERSPGQRFSSLLDLGAGTGAASWAALEVFDEIEQITLIEQDAGLIELGQRLTRDCPNEALRTAEWLRRDLTTAASFEERDLVAISYSLGEIESQRARGILKAAWRAARQALVVIEPGTTKGFQLICAIREELIAEGGRLIAPCPHQRACPLASGGDSGGDWCHFSARFDRTSFHRRVKGAELGYEDEKYSYLAVAKYPAQPAAARVIRRPEKHPGFIRLRLCAEDALTNLTVTRKNKEDWRRARKADWGDSW